MQLRVPGVGGIVDIDPAGRFFVTEGPEESGVIDLRDTATGSTIRRWKGHDGDVNFVAFSDDTELISAADDAGTVWERRTGDEVVSYTSPLITACPRTGICRWHTWNSAPADLSADAKRETSAALALQRDRFVAMRSLASLDVRLGGVSTVEQVDMLGVGGGGR